MEREKWTIREGDDGLEERGKEAGEGEGERSSVNAAITWQGVRGIEGQLTQNSIIHPYPLRPPLIGPRPSLSHKSEVSIG